MSGIGHNGGPALEGTSWRRHCWSKARRDLLPHLPLNVVRRRVARARELGLDYTTYATVRASSGRDIIGFLFSQNALGLHRPGQGVRPEVHAHLAAITDCRLLGLATRALPDDLPLDAVHRAPDPLASFAEQRALILAALAPDRLPAAGVVLVGAAPWERGWCAAARLGGHIDAATCFPASPRP